MTKEEYENLLQSDYWKGYSYSLIKERNFTCEDCGRSFPNMRHMLQVHHLVYRDVNPWSYKPEELIVLCEECHQKRHGIYPDSEPIAEEETTNEKSDKQPYTNTYTEEMSKRYAYDNSPRKKKNWFKLAALVYAIMFLFYLVLKDDSKEQKEQETVTPVETSVSEEIAPEEPIEEIPQVIVKEKPTTKPRKTKRKNSDAEKALVEQTQTPTIEPPIHADPIISQEEYMDSKINENTKSTLELLEERNHASVVKQAQRAGVSTEGSTIEILERINHASVVKQAKEAGVSTEGSTIEILERINHASVVKQAKEAGVSTEGSTIEILERINHASVVKQAKEMGVSTEGSTIEILERINRKILEEYLK